MGLISDYILRDLPRPSWLARPRATAFLKSITEVIDSVVRVAADVRGEGMLASCSDTSLPAHARNGNDRTFVRETFAALRRYLAGRWDRKKEAGTVDGLKAQLARIGCTNAEIVTELDLRLLGTVNPFGGYDGFWFLFLRRPYPWTSVSASWDGGDDWDDADNTDGGPYWGGAIPPDDLAAIRDILRRWKPSGTSCRFVVIDEDGTAGYGPAGLTGNYTLVSTNEAWESLPPAGAVSYFYNTSYLTP